MKQDLKLEILEKLSTLVVAGFGLVAALAWNEAIQKLFKSIFGEASSLGAMLGYAVLVTVVVVLVTYYLGKATKKVKDEINSNKKDNKIEKIETED